MKKFTILLIALCLALPLSVCTASAREGNHGTMDKESSGNMSLDAVIDSYQESTSDNWDAALKIINQYNQQAAEALAIYEKNARWLRHGLASAVAANSQLTWGRQSHYLELGNQIHAAVKNGLDASYSAAMESVVYFTGAGSTVEALNGDDPLAAELMNLLVDGYSASIDQAGQLNTNLRMAMLSAFKDEKLSEEDFESIIAILDQVQELVSSQVNTSADVAASEATSETNAESFTRGNKSAFNAALRHLDLSAFSYDGLIAQLESESFTHSEAVFAVENCGADWNEQALLRAKECLNLVAISYSGMVKQLQSEKFTYTQAIYGADNCGADWNEQAALCAKELRAYRFTSRSTVIEKLQSEGFTYAQAVYGADQNGF